MVQGHFKGLRSGALLKVIPAFVLFVGSFVYGQLLDRVVANVNGEPILESELKVASIFYGIKDREKLIETLIEKHLIAQFLRNMGLEIPQDYIEQLINDIARSNGKSVEEFYEELYSQGVTPDDLKSFLRIEVASTLGLNEFLSSRIEVSEVEIELERLKKGEVEFFKELELLIVSKDKKEILLKLIGEKGTDLAAIAESLGVEPERLKVKRGELLEAIDREVWRVQDGELAIAEDEENIYIAKVLRTVRVFSGRSEDDIRKEIVKRKMEKERERIITKLKKEGFVQILS